MQEPGGKSEFPEFKNQWRRGREWDLLLQRPDRSICWEDSSYEGQYEKKQKSYILPA